MYHPVSVGGKLIDNEQAYYIALKAGLIEVIEKCLMAERGRSVLAIILLQVSEIQPLRL